MHVRVEGRVRRPHGFHERTRGIGAFLLVLLLQLRPLAPAFALLQAADLLLQADLIHTYLCVCVHCDSCGQGAKPILHWKFVHPRELLFFN